MMREVSHVCHLLKTFGVRICNLLLNRCSFSSIVRCSKTSGSSSISLLPRLRICNCIVMVN